MNALRDEARACADAFGQADAFAALNAKISALQATGDAGGVLHSSAGLAHAAREPFDGACLARCERFAEYLQRQFFAPLPFVYEKSAWRNLAFFEAYFSNYIEGTEMTVEEAQQVVFEHRDLAQRSGDSHDVRGSWEICADLEEMSHVPQDASAFLSLLRSRHKVLLRGRPVIDRASSSTPPTVPATRRLLRPSASPERSREASKSARRRRRVSRAHCCSIS